MREAVPQLVVRLPVQPGEALPGVDQGPQPLPGGPPLLASGELLGLGDQRLLGLARLLGLLGLRRLALLAPGLDVLDELVQPPGSAARSPTAWCSSTWSRRCSMAAVRVLGGQIGGLAPGVRGGRSRRPGRRTCARSRRGPPRGSPPATIRRPSPRRLYARIRCPSRRRGPTGRCSQRLLHMMPAEGVRPPGHRPQFRAAGQRPRPALCTCSDGQPFGAGTLHNANIGDRWPGCPHPARPKFRTYAAPPGRQDF